jgi:ornithine decarboxylase
MVDTFDSETLVQLRHETPFFVFSKEKIVNTIREFNECFPNADVHYAMKADAEEEVLRAVMDAGGGFEVASAHELELLKKINVPPEKIFYGTSVKAESHIKAFKDYGVDIFAFDSFSELEKIASIAPGSRVYVRTDVNDSGSIYRFSEKFGTEKENIVPLLVRAQELGLQPYGISFHVGSQASNPLAWARAIGGLHEVFDELKKQGIQIEVLNLGGGFPCMYASTEIEITLKEIADATLEEYAKLPYQPRIVVEPGRKIVADAAVLVTTVISRVERAEHTWLFLDAGVYNGLFETLSYQGSMRYRVSSMRKSYSTGESMFALAGPTGDSWDVMSRETLLPQDIDVGDKLIFHTVGAYNLVMVGRFNGFPKPAVYYV